MDKQYLDRLGFTYTNLTSGYVGLNYDTLLGADSSFISEILAVLEPVITKENYLDIIIGMNDHGISPDKTETSVKTLSSEELPDVIRKGNDGIAFRIEKSLKDTGVYETDYISYAYHYGNIIQKKSKNGASREKILRDRMTDLISKGNLQPSMLQDIARSFTKIATIDDIDIRFFRTFPLKDTGNMYLYNRHGIKLEQIYRNGQIIAEKAYHDDSVTDTTYCDGVPVRIQKVLTGLYGISEIVTEIPTYEGKTLKKTRISHAKKLAEGIQPVCYVHKEYQNGHLFSATINDCKYGKKIFTFSGGGFTMDQDENHIEFTGKIDLPDHIDAMEALRQLCLIEGGLKQLKTHLPEYKIDYNQIFNTIYTEKTNYAIAAIKEKKALIYVADKGNTTIYDTGYKKAVYFPAGVIKKFLPSYRNYPNVMVEQKIKEGQDPEAIRRLYELGTKTTDEETIYAFRRVVRGLSKNPATPAWILKAIVQKIYQGDFESDNIRFIAQNPSADESTLQEIINHSPSSLVMSCIESHPNKPGKIKKHTSKEEAKKAADTILN